MATEERSAGERGYNKRYYLAIWTGILGTFRGWTPEQTRAWAEATFGADLDRDDDLVYHVSPQYWVVLRLVPDGLLERARARGLVDELRARLEDAFRAGDDRFLNYPASTDWAPYKPLVATIIREFEAKLGPTNP